MSTGGFELKELEAVAFINELFLGLVVADVGVAGLAVVVAPRARCVCCSGVVKFPVLLLKKEFSSADDVLVEGAVPRFSNH